jgi:hypothetical protein
VVCQLIGLQKSVNVKGLRNSLKSLPKDLDETYERILCSIDNCHKDYALCILHCVTHSEQPLTTTEVVRLVAIDIAGEGQFDEDEVLSDPLDVITMCLGLINISDEIIDQGCFETSNQYIILAHYSVQEYLVSSRIFQGNVNIWSLEEKLSRSIISQSCLVYLLNMDPSFRGNEPMAKDEDPLARYCARHWACHAKKSFDEGLDDIYRFAKRLFASRDRLPSLQYKSHHDTPSTYPDFKVDLLFVSADAGVEGLALRVLAEDDVNVNTEHGTSGTALSMASLFGHEKYRAATASGWSRC